MSKGKTEGREVSTMGERGPLLPIGIQDQGGVFQREIEFKRWTGGTMRELGKLRGDSKELGMSQHVVMVLSVLGIKLGPYDFTTMKQDEKKLAIHQMYVGDVFYAYCYARMKSLGPSLALDIICPNCRHEFKFVGDLSTLTVGSIGKLDDSYWEYDLDEPITIRGKKAKTLAMGPGRWHNVMNAQVEGSFDIEGGKLAMVAGSIRGVKGKEQYPLTQEEIDSISGYDIEQIIGQLDDKHVGPEMKIDLNCQKCKGRITQPINWGYQSFFASSSRSPASGKSSGSSSSSPTTQTAA